MELKKSFYEEGMLNNFFFFYKLLIYIFKLTNNVHYKLVKYNSIISEIVNVAPSE